MAMLSSCGDGQSDALHALAAKRYALSVAEFHRAAAAGDVEGLELFLKAGTGVDVATGQQRTAVMEAAAAGSAAAVEWLIAHQAKLGGRDKDGVGLALASVKGGNARVLVSILDAGVEVVPEDRLLSHAANLGHLEIMQVLLPRCGPEVQDAFFAAARAGRVEVAESLLRAGGSVFKTEPEFDRTPLMLAAMGGHKEMVEFLLHTGSNRFALDTNGLCALELALSANHKDAALVLSAPLQKEERELGLLPHENADFGLKEVSALDAVAVGDAVQLVDAPKPIGKLATEIGKADSGQDVVRKLRLRRVREILLPWYLDSLGETDAIVRDLQTGTTSSVSVTGGDFGGGWKIFPQTAAATVPQWMRKSVRMRDRDGKTGRMVIAGVPVRAGGVCAILEAVGRDGKYEARVGDQLFASGPLEAPWVVDSIDATSVVVARKDGARLVIEAQGVRSSP